MKKVLIIASIALLSASTQAENSVEVPKAIQIDNHATFDLVMAQSGENKSNLWELLDSNRDGFLSRTEASFSKEVIANWDKLDSNKDEKLDIREFSYFSILEN